jgi:hypothetical protein
MALPNGGLLGDHIFVAEAIDDEDRVIGLAIDPEASSALQDRAKSNSVIGSTGKY